MLRTRPERVAAWIWVWMDDRVDGNKMDVTFAERMAKEMAQNGRHDGGRNEAHKSL